MSWNPRNLLLLRTLWEQGLSMGIIAKRLSMPDWKVTRSMVAGRIRRLQIKRAVQKPVVRLADGEGDRRDRRHRRRPDRKKPVTIVPTVLTAEPEYVQPAIKSDRQWARGVKNLPADGTACDLLDLGPDGCKWPVAYEDGKHLFCNTLRRRDQSYCALHGGQQHTRDRRFLVTNYR